MSRYRNLHSNGSIRLQHWDYRRSAAYFITICTKNREWFFDDVVGGTMQLSSIGILADVLWCEIRHHARNVILGPFVVMPDHVYGIILLNGNERVVGDPGVINDMDVSTGPVGPVGPRHALGLRGKPIGENRFQNQGKNTVSSIIGSYKSAVTRHARRLGFRFARQFRFYDHIIRDDQAYARISKYIEYNPVNWCRDRKGQGLPCP